MTGVKFKVFKYQRIFTGTKSSFREFWFIFSYFMTLYVRSTKSGHNLIAKSIDQFKNLLFLERYLRRIHTRGPAYNVADSFLIVIAEKDKNCIETCFVSGMFPVELVAAGLILGIDQKNLRNEKFIFKCPFVSKEI